eukprot:scaffold309227_cov39-Prasinocladus_malaysianus.AAC.1
MPGGPAGLVHQGFLEQLQAALPVIDDYISMRRPKQIFVTGHSLGGALATLFAGMLSHRAVTARR